ncbi:hypothetical protein RHMOL_Rhmol11G0127500 [Rhododendron molle]|uniref:Uncharacterized protein n=1 Tax=Rhododendron molle TaxID=49168 RepID=A0ACC0LSK5_RHOML|nr:hypothetical protein RHMOL_Rhmol11G0127500 [Rhododendron molle]
MFQCWNGGDGENGPKSSAETVVEKNVEKKTKVQTKESQRVEKKEVPTESTIEEAIKKRASYLKANSNTVTMARFRRLLEEDLELDKDTLFPFKKFITEQVEKVSKTSGIVPFLVELARKMSMCSFNLLSQVLNLKEKISKSQEPRKRKRSVKETKESSKKRSKLAEASEENSDAEAG